VLAHRAEKFDPAAALALMARHGVRNAFIPPTALRLLRTVPDAARFGARPRSLISGGEALGEELLDWSRGAFHGATLAEMYGQTECNLVIGDAPGRFPHRPGSMGRAVPGHAVAIVDGEGEPQPPGTPGTIAIRRPDPVMFLRYWNNPAATARKFAGDWLLTGDSATMDSDGHLFFHGRDDDVITSAGYRIGPAEVEHCLTGHPDVALAAVIGLPDPIRTEQVCAVIVPRPGATPNLALASALQAHVRDRLAAHLYPREIRFLDALPLTATGKIMRGELRRRFAREGDA
jgi:acetyl-CoA synthetase